MTIRFGNQLPKPISDSEYLPTPEFQKSFDYALSKREHLDRLTKVFNDHNANMRLCACEFCRVFKRELLR